MSNRPTASRFAGLGQRRGQSDNASGGTEPRPEFPISDVPSPVDSTAPDRSTPVRSTRVAKRGNPDYVNLTVYIRKGTRQQVAVRLAGAPEKMEVSELVELLLQEWLVKQPHP